MGGNKLSRSVAKNRACVLREEKGEGKTRKEAQKAKPRDRDCSLKQLAERLHVGKGADGQSVCKEEKLLCAFKEVPALFIFSFFHPCVYPCPRM